MNDWIASHEAAVRVTAFLAGLAILLAAEWRWPRRSGPPQRALRWRPNLSMVVLDAAAVRLLLPLGAIGAAVVAANSGLGLLHQVEAPGWVEAVIAFVVLDALIYAQHRLFHAVPVLWRLHRMHHSDVEFDATTGLRFHPAEIVLSMLIKMAAVVVLGAPVLAVLAFEVALNASAMFSHANLRLPAAVDRVLRRVIVTPDMHRVHHSTHRREHDRNFGFNLSWWDRLFGSYKAQPDEGHLEMRIGLPDFREETRQRLGALLVQPLAPLGPETTTREANGRR